MKIQQQKNGQYTITLPSDIVKGFDWKKGDIIEFRIIGPSELRLKKKSINKDNNKETNKTL